MKINAKKSAVMIFSNESHTRYNFTLGTEKIEITSKYTYLGLDINDKMDKEMLIKKKIQNGEKLLAAYTKTLTN